MEDAYNMVDDLCAKIERDQRRRIRELEEELAFERRTCNVVLAALIVVAFGFMWFM